MKRIASTIIITAIFLSPSVSYANFDVDLKLGSRTMEVADVQRFLKKYACYNGPLTNFFFVRTRAAVKCFQERHGISERGIWGPKTRAKANEILKLTGEYNDAKPVITLGTTTVNSNTNTDNNGYFDSRGNWIQQTQTPNFNILYVIPGYSPAVPTFSPPSVSFPGL